MHSTETGPRSAADDSPGAETGTGGGTGTGGADPDIVIAGLSKTVRRQRVFLAAACVAALAAGGGLAASTMIESPAQQAAETKPPKPTVLTAPVVKKVLTETVTTRGTVGAGGDISVSPAAGGGAGTSSGSGTVSLVVSKLYARAGDQIHAGQVLIEVSGRPIIALSGAVPAYRDLKPGMDGPDVAQLQTALKQLGHDCAPDALGHFGDGTKRALTELYTAAGYSVPTTGGGNDTGGSSAPGLVLPASEVVFVPSFPVRLAKLNATLGSTVTAPLLTLESGRLIVTSLLQPGQNSLVKAGVKVQLTAEALGQTATATVTSIGPYSDGSASSVQNGNGQNSGTGGSTAGPSSGQAAGSNAAGGQQPTQLPGYPMTVTPDAPLNPDWAGQDVRVTIINAATTGAVLTVPLSAVSTGADGHATVTVVTADGTQRRVPVNAGASADGDVAVTPADADALREGDAVAIGQAPQ